VAQVNTAFLPRSIITSTIPANGDLNPYGVAFVPSNFPTGGTIAAGDVLVANFNNIANLQGTGTTIIQFTPTGDLAPGVSAGSNGNATTFFQSPLLGLDTALGVLSGGFVVVGNVPTTDGTVDTISQGALQVLDRNGNLVATWIDSTFLDSPWDLTINDAGATAQIFVSNVLSGTVSRLDVVVGSGSVAVVNKVRIAAGYTHQPNDAALVLGPTGLAYDVSIDTLYVASTADNAIYAVSGAGHAGTSVNRGSLVFSDPHLRGPLALVLAPNGDLLTANGDAVNSDLLHPSEIVEFSPTGDFVSESNVDASQGGAFGMAITTTSGPSVAIPFLFTGLGSGGTYIIKSTGGSGLFNYAFIDDVANDLTVTFVPFPQP
jgi:hypothetical protein